MLKPRLPLHTMALSTVTCKPGQWHCVHTWKTEWIFNPADQKWRNKIKISVRQLSAHKAYYPLMRFEPRSSSLTPLRSKHTSETGTLRNRLTASPEPPPLTLRCH